MKRTKKEIIMFKFTGKLLRNEKKKAFGIVMGIAISVMFMFSIMQLGDSLLNQYMRYGTQGKHQDLSIHRINEEMANEIVREVNKDRPDNPFAYSIMQKGGEFSFDNKRGRSALLIAGNEKDIQNMHDIKIIEGTFPKEAYEIAISKEFNNQLIKPLNIGDKVQLYGQETSQINSNIEWKLTGFIEGEQYLKPMLEEKSQIWTSNTTMTALQNEGIIFDKHIILELMEFRNKMSYLAMDMKDIEDDPLFEAVDKVLMVIDPVLYTETKGKKETTEKEREGLKELYGKIEFNSDKEAILTKARLEGEFGSEIKIPSIFIVLSTSAMIFCVMHLSIVEHIRRYGMLRCIGLSKRQLRRMLAYEYLGYGSIGIILGLCAGIVFNHFIGATVLSMLVQNEDMMIIQSASSYMVTIGLTLLSIFVAFTIICIKLRKLSPYDMRKFEEITKVSTKKKKIVVKTKGQLVLHFVNHNLSRSLTKTMTITVSIAISIFFILTLLNIFTTVGKPQQEMKSKFANIELLSNSINEEHDISEKEAAQLAKVNDVDALYKISQGYRNSIVNEQGEFINYVVYSDNLIDKFQELNQDSIKSNVLPSDNIILVNPVSSLNSDPSPLRGVKKNTDMNITIQKLAALPEEKTKASIRIDAVVDGDLIPLHVNSQKIAQPTLILRERKAKELFGTLEYTHLFVSTKGAITDTQQQAFTAILKNHVEAQQNLLGDEASGSYEQLIGLLVIAGYVGIITMISGISSMINTMKANFKSHTKEYAIMRSVGMSKKTLCTITALEMMFLTLLAFLLATMLSVPLQTYISQIQVDEVIIQPWIYGIVFLCSMLFVGVLSYVIARKATTFTIHESLQEDN